MCRCGSLRNTKPALVNLTMTCEANTVALRASAILVWSFWCHPDSPARSCIGVVPNVRYRVGAPWVVKEEVIENDLADTTRLRGADLYYQWRRK
jgi:hypothetical protein